MDLIHRLGLPFPHEKAYAKISKVIKQCSRTTQRHKPYHERRVMQAAYEALCERNSTKNGVPYIKSTDGSELGMYLLDCDSKLIDKDYSAFSYKIPISVVKINTRSSGKGIQVVRTGACFEASSQCDLLINRKIYINVEPLQPRIAECAQEALSNF